MNSSSTTYRRNAGNKGRDQLILDHMDYVAQILSTMTIGIRNEDDRETLRSAGILGLVESANSFDHTKGNFRTFAYTRIRGAIIDELRKMSPVSQQALAEIGKLKSAYEKLEPPVSPEMLSEATGLELDRVLVCLEAMRFLDAGQINDLDSVVHGSWKSGYMTPGHETELQEMRELLAEAIKQLPERERLVVTLYYSDDLNLAEIGRVLDLSESRVSRLLAASRFNLQEYIRDKTR